MHGKVVWLSIVNNPNVDLRKFQGNPSRPRNIPRPRGIQAGAFSQRRRERPRRSNTPISIWRRQENLSWTSLCWCYNLHCHLVRSLRIQCDESERREWQWNPRQGRGDCSKGSRHVSPGQVIAPIILLEAESVGLLFLKTTREVWMFYSSKR